MRPAQAAEPAHASGRPRGTGALTHMEPLSSYYRPRSVSHMRYLNEEGCEEEARDGEEKAGNWKEERTDDPFDKPLPPKPPPKPPTPIDRSDPWDGGAPPPKGPDGGPPPKKRRKKTPRRNNSQAGQGSQEALRTSTSGEPASANFHEAGSLFLWRRCRLRRPARERTTDRRGFRETVAGHLRRCRSASAATPPHDRARGALRPADLPAE